MNNKLNIDNLIKTEKDSRNCLVCERAIDNDFILECRCDICKYCLYNWVVEKNYTILYKDFDISCPNHKCRKQIALQFIYKNLKYGQVAVINEVFFKKYSVINKDIKKCPRNDCSYLGFTDNVRCKTEFKCEVCNESWFDPDIRLVTFIDKLVHFLLSSKQNFLTKITDLTIMLSCKPCIFCDFIIYRFEGCKHMTCA